MTTENRNEATLRTLAALLGIITIIAAGSVLYVTQSVLIPLVIAWLLSCVFGPVVHFLTERKAPLSLAITFVILLAFFVLLQAVLFLSARVQAFAGEYETYAAKLNSLITSLGENLPKTIATALKEIKWQGKAAEYLTSIAARTATVLWALVIVMIFVVFILMGQPHFTAKLQLAFSQEDTGRIGSVIERITTKIGQYMALQLAISAVTGVCVWFALHLIGVDFAKTWGALAFMLNFIPTLGSIIASIPPILVATVQFAPDETWKAVVTAASLLCIQMIIGNGIAPKVMGDRLNLSPVVVLLSLLFWGWLWGVVGALLSVPIAAAIKIICDSVEPLHPVGIMMGAGPTSPENAHLKPRGT